MDGAPGALRKTKADPSLRLKTATVRMTGIGIWEALHSGRSEGLADAYHVAFGVVEHADDRAVGNLHGAH
jgi:hypothetical protein